MKFWKKEKLEITINWPAAPLVAQVGATSSIKSEYKVQEAVSAYKLPSKDQKKSNVERVARTRHVSFNTCISGASKK